METLAAIQVIEFINGKFASLPRVTGLGWPLRLALPINPCRALGTGERSLPAVGHLTPASFFIQLQAFTASNGQQSLQRGRRDLLLKSVEARVKHHHGRLKILAAESPGTIDCEIHLREPKIARFHPVNARAV